MSKASTKKSSPRPAAASDSSPEQDSTLAVAPGPISQSPIPLADMNVPQLGEAFSKLDEARGRYEALSGICATLQGLVLIEVKRKLGHGKYGPWLKEYFPKSQDTAERFVRLATVFIERLSIKNTPESKIRTRAEFGAQQLLLGDLASNLAAIEQAKLDMSHPVVEAVSAFVAGRSYRQMLFDHPAFTGGARESTKPKPTPQEEYEAELKLEQTLCNDAYAAVRRIQERKSWRVLNDAELDSLIDAAEALQTQLKDWRKMPKRERTALLIKLEEAKA